MELFPLAPNWIRPVVERLEWLTDVIEGYDATEERTPLRTLPRRSLEYPPARGQSGRQSRRTAMALAGRAVCAAYLD